MEKMVKCLLLAMLLVLVLPAVCMRFLNRKTILTRVIKEEVVYSGLFRLSEVNSGFQDFTQTPFFLGAGNSDTIM